MCLASPDSNGARKEVDFDRVEKENAANALTPLAVEAESVRDSYADTVGADTPGDLVMKDLSYTYKRVQDDTQRAKRGLLFSKELLVRLLPEQRRLQEPPAFSAGGQSSSTLQLLSRAPTPCSVTNGLSPQVWALGLGQQPQLLEKLEKTRAELQEADQQVNRHEQPEPKPHGRRSAAWAAQTGFLLHSEMFWEGSAHYIGPSAPMV